MTTGPPGRLVNILRNVDVNKRPFISNVISNRVPYFIQSQKDSDSSNKNTLKQISSDRNFAATKIQSTLRGFFSRKATNIYGRSQGKEIEVYLPFGSRDRNSGICSYDMVGECKYIICESDLFVLQIDPMKFIDSKNHKNILKIPEIATMPFRQTGETQSNLPSEEDIDNAVGDFLLLLENFVRHAVTQCTKQYLLLDDLIKTYNAKHARHPLRLATWLRAYLKNPQYEDPFGEIKTMETHRDIELCFLYERDFEPIFDEADIPRTQAAAEIISEHGYKRGNLLIHVQETFSLPMDEYTPNILSREKNPALHNTAQQLKVLHEARRRSELFVKEYPLPERANPARILGLLTLCVEHMLSVLKAKEYIGLHEKADRPVLSVRHILHYIKINVCNDDELTWFNDMFKNHREDITNILCENSYIPDYQGNGGNYGNVRGMSESARYDAIFDLFGNFANTHSLSQMDHRTTLTAEEFQKMRSYGIESWKDVYKNHLSLCGRTHLRLQKVNKNGQTEYHPLFEARRIGIMTITEFKEGKSHISIPGATKNNGLGK